MSGASLKHQICIVGCKLTRADMKKFVPVECFWLTEDLDWVVLDVNKLYDWLKLIRSRKQSLVYVRLAQRS